MRPLSATLLLAIAAFPAPVLAQTALRVQPLTVEVTSPSQASAINLQNRGPRPMTLQVRVFDWSQANGQDQVVPTTDVVASPPAMTIPPGQSYTIRLARTAGAVTSGEKSYRLWIDELPPPARSMPAGGGEVDVRLRYDLPAFFRAGDPQSNLNWRVYRSGGQLVVEATNSGAGHARVEGLRLEDGQGTVSFGRGLNGYVLPGATRRWVAPTGAPLPAANANVTVMAGVGGREIRQATTIAAR
jgi:fimbrial chaperone protein